MAADNEHAAEIPYIANAQEFAAVCELPNAIIYIEIGGSEQERQSRQVFQKALQQLDTREMPIYRIDCSDQKQEYFENWLIVQEHHVHLFYTAGYGEILFVQQGEVKDFINFPGKAGLEATKARLANWIQG